MTQWLPWRLLWVLVLGVLGTPSLAYAHEMRPSLLELTPRDDGRVAVHFNIGFAQGAPMDIVIRLPEQCQATGPTRVRDTATVRSQQWIVDCGKKGLNGIISAEGLAKTGTDVIVRTPSGVVVLRATAPMAALPTTETDGRALHGSVLTAYIRIGVEHIARGADHLVFVLGLLLLVGPRWRTLVQTISTFTAAHSVTLALATLDVVRLPTRAVEAVIAASIVVLARELIHPTGSGWAQRAPWVFALVCGLVHGFGFASVLSEVGLPAGAVPLALLGFNVGVELGQLTFVGVLCVLGTALRAADAQGAARLSRVSIVAVSALIGTTGALWLWQRVVPILIDAAVWVRTF